MLDRCGDVLCVVFMQQQKQQVKAEQALATALRRQLEEVPQAKQQAAQVESVTPLLSACCTLGTYST